MIMNKMLFRRNLILMAVLLCASSMSMAMDKSKEMTKVTPVYGNPTETHAMKVPKQVRFCNQTIDLRRMDIRERFDRELMSMNYMHSATLQMIKRANRYFPVIEPILKANNVPDDMKYLCCIESGMNPKSVSSVGAAGLWQFMSSTAQEYGLQVNSDVDERYHIEKSTVAACQYLKDAYEIYKDWNLVAAAYNAGKRRITQELEKQKVDNYFDLYLNEETSRYVYRILACKWVLEHLKDYGFHLEAEDLYQPIAYKKVIVNTAVPDWAAFAVEQGTTYKQLKEANLWIKGNVMLNKAGRVYEVKIPASDKALLFDEKKLKTHQPAWIYE